MIYIGIGYQGIKEQCRTCDTTYTPGESIDIVWHDPGALLPDVCKVVHVA